MLLEFIIILGNYRFHTVIINFDFIVFNPLLLNNKLLLVTDVPIVILGASARSWNRWQAYCLFPLVIISPARTRACPLGGSKFLSHIGINSFHVRIAVLFPSSSGLFVFYYPPIII